MEIVLNKDDIEALIRRSYNGVKAVKFNVKNLKATLNINFKEFLGPVKTTGVLPDKANINKQATTKKDDMSPEEIYERERAKGLMASGGQKRIIRNM